LKGLGVGGYKAVSNMQLPSIRIQLLYNYYVNIRNIIAIRLIKADKSDK